MRAINAVFLLQDLNKWKTRRRSGKSDLLRSSQDREHVITQMTNGAMADFEKNEAQGPIKRYEQLWFEMIN